MRYFETVSALQPCFQYKADWGAMKTHYDKFPSQQNNEKEKTDEGKQEILLGYPSKHQDPFK